MRFLAAWLAVWTGVAGLLLALKIITDGSVTIYEPNLAILYFEASLASALVLLGVYLFLKGLLNGTWTS